MHRGYCHLMLLMAICTCGCQWGRSRADKLEARLRQHVHQQTMLEDQLAESRRELAASISESESLRLALAQSGKEAPPTEYLQAAFQVVELKVNPLFTASFSSEEGGSAKLHLLLAPVDETGQPVKLAGELDLTATNAEPAAGTDARLAHWKFSTADVRKHWFAGTLGSGFQFELTWPDVPPSGSVTVHAVMKLADGRTLKATHLLKTRLGEGDEMTRAVPDHLQSDARVSRGGVRQASLEENLVPLPPDDGVTGRMEKDSGDAWPRSSSDQSTAKSPTRSRRPTITKPTVTSDRWREEDIPRLR